MPRSVDPEIKARNDEIVRARLEGSASLAQLAAKYGLSREAIRLISAAAGVDGKKAAEAYKLRRPQIDFEKAENNATVILMRYIAGQSAQQIAREINLTLKSVQEVLEERITDEVIAARANNKTEKNFPNVANGPKDEAQRSDRRWTADHVFDTLVRFAREQNGLPSSTQYQKIAPKREDLPSFCTVRNRLGRWSNIRVDVHKAMKGNT